MGLFRHRRSPKKQGIIGERLENGVIKKYHSRNGRYFRWIPNYTFYKSKGHSVQLDNVVINSSGIFIIEVKNWEGVIRGTFDDTKWEQRRRGHRPHHYDNPIKQNISHTKSFKQHYKGKFPVYSLVIMAANNKPRNVIGVRNIRELPNYFNEYSARIYNKDMVDQEYKYLVSIKDRISEGEHIRNVERAKVERKQNIQEAKRRAALQKKMVVVKKVTVSKPVASNSRMVAKKPMSTTQCNRIHSISYRKP